jgi:imidazolonepropionase-like amidohydrolase
MAEAGLGAAAAIRAATHGSACALGLANVGTVEPGQIADLLVVDGDPLADPAILLEPERIRLVIQAGRVVGGTRRAPSDIRP